MHPYFPALVIWDKGRNFEIKKMLRNAYMKAVTAKEISVLENS